MVCQACGSPIEAGGRFCPRCGAQVAAQPVPPPVNAAGYTLYPPGMLSRVPRHLQTLGVLWCVFGAYRVLAGFLGLFVFRAMAWRHHFGWDGPFGWGGMHHGMPWMGFLPVIVTVTVAMAALALLAGYGLLTRKPWGRVLAIVLGVLALVKVPLGTALGIYTLWVLAPANSAVEYDAIADRS